MTAEMNINSNPAIKDAWQKETKEELFNRLGLGVKKPQSKGKNDASQIGDFMTLFMAQLQHQNPLDPQDGAEFSAQLAQFNAVERLQKIDKSMQEMAASYREGRVLEATGLIGKEIEVDTNKMQLSSVSQESGYVTNIVTGKIHVPDIAPGTLINDMRIVIKDANSGEVIQRLQHEPPVSRGDIEFTWDGSDADGKRLKTSAGKDIQDGVYSIHPEILVENKWRTLGTSINTKVDSVSVPEKGKVMLHAATIGSIALDDLKRISDGRTGYVPEIT